MSALRGSQTRSGGAFCLHKCTYDCKIGIRVSQHKSVGPTKRKDGSYRAVRQKKTANLVVSCCNVGLEDHMVLYRCSHRDAFGEQCCRVIHSGCQKKLRELLNRMNIAVADEPKGFETPFELTEEELKLITEAALIS